MSEVVSDSPGRRVRRHIVAAVLAAACLLVPGARRVFAQATNADLKRMSLQDLLDIQVTTVSRQPELATAEPAAVFVITQEDIRRSGATSIPEALRLAPGIQVTRIDAAKWAIGMRGFADRLARSVLVLMDGRAVYSPLFAGTYWEVQDTVMEDIDRIEVIRGPGGTLWGANAINGIINIITKGAKDTQGVLARVGTGTEDRGLGVFRYGGVADGGSLHYRAYAKGLGRTSEYHADGNGYDGLNMAQGGFRGDWTLANRRSFTLQGDAYDARLGERAASTSYTAPFRVLSNQDAPLSGGNALARLAGAMGGKADFQLQMYYDRTNRHERPVSENRDTFDVDYQQTEHRSARQEWMWGLGYRVTSDRVATVPPTQFVPDQRTDNLFSGFAQDDITLVANRLRATVGSKVEHNAYSGFELQPSGRLLWTPAPAHTVWAAVTRAVRTPSPVETDYTTTSLANAAGPVFVRLLPDPGFRPEKLVAYETGYRVRPASSVYLTISGFYNQLNDTLSTEVLPTFVERTQGPPRLIIPVDFANGLHGSSHGAEATAQLRLLKWWGWTTNYSYLRVAMSRNPGSHDASQERNYEGTAPHHQVQLRSSFDLPRGWSADWTWRYVSRLTASAIPAYATSDVRISWRATPRLELAVVGQDLNQARHYEWPSGTGANVAIERSGYVAITWRQ